MLCGVRGGEVSYTEEGEETEGPDDIIFTPAGHAHGLNNTSEEEVLLRWGWRGAGSILAAGYELHDHR